MIPYRLAAGAILLVACTAMLPSAAATCGSQGNTTDFSNSWGVAYCAGDGSPGSVGPPFHGKVGSGDRWRCTNLGIDPPLKDTWASVSFCVFLGTN